MTFNIFSPDKKLLGSIALENGKVLLVNNSDPAFNNLIQGYLRDGVTIITDTFDPQRKISTLNEVKVLPADQNFVLALKKCLENEGYEINEDTSDIDQRVTELLKRLDESGGTSKQTVDNLSGMSMLQKTYLLQELESEVIKL